MLTKWTLRSLHRDWKVCEVNDIGNFPRLGTFMLYCTRWDPSSLRIVAHPGVK